ncbi:MAG: hypothetical protein IJP86_04645 [Synergistaceae bacterium]|nr:hypothetical protein [Synergistaceae bacterium]
MKRVMLMLSVIVLVTAGTSAAFADNEARDAMIAYSGTEAFAKLLPEERQACMYWVSEGGKMSEACRSAVVRLITDAPDAVTPSQRRALLEAASNTDEAASKKSDQPPAPIQDNKPTVEKSDNTGAIIAAGVVGIIAGMIIHNNWPSHRDSGPSYNPPPPPRHPAPPHHDRRPPGR